MSGSSFQRRRAPLLTRLRGRARAATPVLVWLLAVGGALYLMQGRRQRTPVTGLVEARQHSVIVPMEGRLAALMVALHEDVAAGQLLARISDQDLRLRLQRERFELERMRADLRQREAELQHQEQTAVARSELDMAVELRRLTHAVEVAQLDALATRADLAEVRVRSQGLAVETERLAELTQRGMMSDTELVRKRTELDALHKRIAELEQILVERRAHTDACQQRLDRFAAGAPPTLPRDAALEPLRWLLKEQETRIDQLVLEAGRLDLLAPAAGRVASLNHGPGEWLRAGTVMLTIADPTPRRILAYVPEALRAAAAPARAVAVVRPGTGAVLGQAAIASVSAAVVRVPERLWRDPQREEWAWEIVVPPTGLEAPGELVGLLFR